MIDDDDFHRTFLRFQFQAELFLKSREQRRAIGIYRRKRRHVRAARPRGGAWNWPCSGVYSRLISYFPVRLVLSSTIRPVKRESTSNNCVYRHLLATEMAGKHEEATARQA